LYSVIIDNNNNKNNNNSEEEEKKEARRQARPGHPAGRRCRRRWWCNVCSLIVLLIRTIYIMDELGDKRSRKCARRRKGAMK
jgi:hypothetical protein